MTILIQLLLLLATILQGQATYYDDGPGLYAAVNSWRWGDTPYNVKVCRTDGAACVTVIVRDYCACGGKHVIDLSPTAFKRLAPLSRGVVDVTVRRGGKIVAPPTYTE